jgi:two-component system response regulator YesN
MNLLIVDDEPLAVRSVVNAIDWSRLHIDSVLEANSASQAKELFAREPIDIMLCDIEMPKESGLKLLAWVREQYPATAPLLLTCHADFQFAQEAIKLGSVDYLLKPIPPDELEAAIRKAINLVHTQQEMKRQRETWVKHHPLFIERFWMDVLKREIPGSPEAIAQTARERNIHLPEGQITLIRVQVHRWSKSLSMRDEKIMEYALANALEETCAKLGASFGIVTAERGCLLAMIEVKAEWRSVRAELEAYIADCRRFFYCDLSVYVGEPTQIHEIPEMNDRLATLMLDNIASENQVLFLGASHRKGSTIDWPDMKIWQFMLRDGARSALLEEVEDFFRRLRQASGLSVMMLHQFYQDMLQVVYTVLNEKGIRAHQLFQDKVSIELADHAVRSVYDMWQWTSHLIGKALDYQEEIKAHESVVEKVKQFIVDHLGEELNRESIASRFFLHPDYLNRLFKRETGLSMTEYLLIERMRMAAELLRKTDMPVTDIALQVSYSNVSHFAKLFKKQFGVNPNEYRQAARESRKCIASKSKSER